MNSSRRQHLIRLIAIVVVVFSLVTLACSVTDKLFVDTEATNEAIQRTDEAQDARSTERALEKTQDAINDQATQVAEQATQNALDLQGTQQAQQATQQAQQLTSQAQQNQSQNQSGGSTFGSGQYTFYVENDSSQTVCYLYMSLSTSDTWGDDLLGSSTLSSGSSYTVTGVPGGTYDLLAKDCSGNELASEYGVIVPANDTWTLSDTGSTGGSGGTGGTGSYTLYIDNYSSSSICYLYVSPTTSTTWGEDWLGSDVISANTSYYFTGVAAGDYDLKAEDCSHNVIAQYNGFNIPTYDTWQVYNP